MVTPEELNLKRNKERLEKEFFIDRYGSVHKCKRDMNDEIVSFHESISSELFPDVSRPKDFIMNTGWIMAGSSVYNCPIIHKKPTQSQINTLYDLGLYEKLCILKNGFYVKYTEFIK